MQEARAAGDRERFLCTLEHVLISGMHVCGHCISGQLRDLNHIFQNHYTVLISIRVIAMCYYMYIQIVIK